MTTIMHNAPRAWTLDEAIEHELHTKEVAAQMAAMPSADAMKFAEKFYLSDDLLFRTRKARKSRKETERAWTIVLPDSTGRKVRWGCKLILVEKTPTPGHPSEMFRFDLYAHTTRLRRLVSPRFRNWYGRVPFFGTLWIQMTKEDAGYSWFPAGLASVDKYTKSIA